MAYKFYIDDMLLPVTPSSVKISVGDKNEVIELLNNTDLIILRSPSLKEIFFEAILPANKVDYAVYENNVFQAPQDFITKIQKLKYDKKNFLFSILRENGNKKYFDTVIKCILSDFEFYEGVEEGLDVRVSFNLKEYKVKTTQVGKVLKDEQGNSFIQYEQQVENEKQQIGSIYVVKDALDTLWKISKKTYDDGSKYTSLQIPETLQEWDIYEHGGPNYLKVRQEILLLENALKK